MGANITITQRQTPTFRALIKDSGGRLFNPIEDLATWEELEAEGITAHPVSFSIRRSTNALVPYDANLNTSEPVEGYQNIEITATAFLEPDAVEELGTPYNFQYTPESRANFPFQETGYYIADFVIYPKQGAAIVFRIGITVK